MVDDDVGLGAEAVEGDGLEGEVGFGCDFGEAGEALGVEVPAEDALEGALAEGGAELEGGLVAGADHAEDLRIRAGEVLDRDGGGGGGAGGGQVVAADHRGGAAGVRVEEVYRGLVVGEVPPRHVVGPVAAGLEAEGAAGAVEAALEAVERVLVAEGFADHREVAGVAAGHGGEDRLDGGDGFVERQKAGAGGFGDDEHGGIPGERFCWKVKR